jgi:hypothetical protein
VEFYDEVRDLLIFFSFSKIWNGLFMVVINSMPGSNNMKFDDFVGALLSEEMRCKITSETSCNP